MTPSVPVLYAGIGHWVVVEQELVHEKVGLLGYIAEISVCEYAQFSSPITGLVAFVSLRPAHEACEVREMLVWWYFYKQWSCKSLEDME